MSTIINRKIIDDQDIKVINTIQYYVGHAEINGDKLLAASTWRVEPFFNGSSQPSSTILSVISSTETKVVVSLNNSIAVPGLIKGCVQSTCATNFWNPVVIANVSSVPTEGGTLTVRGNYLQQTSTLAPNVLLFQNHQIKQSGTNRDATEIYFPFPTNISQLDAGRNVSVVVNIRNTGNNAMFSYQKPSIDNIAIVNNTMLINGDSFGADKDLINITIENTVTAHPTSLINHFNISVDLESNNNISKLFSNPGVYQFEIDVKNNPSTVYKYTLLPLLESTSRVDSNGGKITIIGKHLGLGNISSNQSTIITIGNNISCLNISYPTTDGISIICSVPPNGNKSLVDQLLPVIIKTNGYTSIPSLIFKYSKEITIDSSEKQTNITKDVYVSNNTIINTNHSSVVTNVTTTIPIVTTNTGESDVKSSSGSQSSGKSSRQMLWIIAPALVGLLAIVGVILFFIYYKRKLNRKQQKSIDELPPGWDSKEDLEIGGIVLCYDEKIDGRRLKAGKFETMVRHLSFSKLANRDVIKCFLLSFRSYASRMELLDLLIDCYQCKKRKQTIQPLPSNEEVHMRIGYIAQQWLEEHQYDFTDSQELSEKMTRFIQRKLKRDCPEIFHRILVLLSPAPSVIGTMVQLPHLMEVESSKPVVTVENPDILNLDAAEIARQLTLLEASNHLSVEDKEFFHLAPSHERILYRIPKLLTLTSQYNAISNWVTSEVMTKRQLDSRIKVVEKFIQVAKHLKEIHNFNGCFEILDGLKYHSVQFLAKTWANVDSNLINDYQELCQLFTEENDYLPYREHLKNFIGHQCIPFGLSTQSNTGPINGKAIDTLVKRSTALNLKVIKRVYWFRNTTSNLFHLNDFLGFGLTSLVDANEYLTLHFFYRTINQNNVLFNNSSFSLIHKLQNIKQNPQNIHYDCFVVVMGTTQIINSNNNKNSNINNNNNNNFTYSNNNINYNNNNNNNNNNNYYNNSFFNLNNPFISYLESQDMEIEYLSQQILLLNQQTLQMRPTNQQQQYQHQQQQQLRLHVIDTSIKLYNTQVYSNSSTSVRSTTLRSTLTTQSLIQNLESTT
ncbi:hypothetical protein PPL_07125 [Heterostelium album PN500]|uniref:Ras guanine nucleotide exchange factor n=1 Tax=Heterostelium pallidum (strain ATCC 26659 / Pp 5 / PN500) TaxID=670386 RepID=D3BEG5_HETP5|nr:hypothetical protein PPL_07125 [Heterostelium album PN500]EFA80296.1 hypothetical protein PPL_07125 [Heterostelium album PN500]|eukprot:XP_020432416.1 hypothetical protein PPL_07125 [Heterostelium album PN500]